MDDGLLRGGEATKRPLNTSPYFSPASEPPETRRAIGSDGGTGDSLPLLEGRRDVGSGGTGDRRPEEAAEHRRDMGSEGGMGDKRPEERGSTGVTGASVDEEVDAGETGTASSCSSSSTLCE